jgi:nicotinate-nucleotide adenylyltransferase
MKKVGLFFGSFNPIHIGHLAIANYIVEFTELDRIWFVVTPHNPLKPKKTLLADNHRYYMVNLAVEDNRRFKASNIEFKLPQPSYTVNTLAYLKEKYPDLEFSLIMGADNILTIQKWKNYEYILQNYKIYVYPRPGYNLDNINYKNVITVNAPIMQISASFIRNAIKSGKDVRYFLLPKVWEFIDEMRFISDKLSSFELSVRTV